MTHINFFSFDIVTLIKTMGIAGVAGIVFAETGLLIGFFFPGDSLLFSAGFLASTGALPIAPLIIVSFGASALGDSVGYAIGRRLGPKLFSKNESFFFQKSHVTKTQRYFEIYGSRTIFIARFIPIVRTFAPVLAGVGSMHYSTFLTYNLCGAVVWGAFIPLLGYFLGSKIPNIDHYLLPIIAGIIIISILPIVGELLRHRVHKKK